ncbi:MULTISPECIES: hypothetical protein [unclassified Moritella]|uniref:hypothetical protein n=1 Tax=unclassified Moritella TaxID=2637987 RepID=UPI001BA8D0D7|nr:MULTISPECIES: hypothetical protein [unclassified Moritella]QUM80477.1 hypothetical protein HWV01_09395 [Moritella sp. 5]QUM84740.1 hypothetical protein HWV02_09635 [Moritella sp. 28]QUM88987.1 hypothetical protein HWV03_09360 [Moritella sp. 36]
MSLKTINRITVKSFILSLFVLLFSAQSFAYSYAAAGKEPLIEGREALLKALSANDYTAVQTAYDSMQKEFVYFNEHHGLAVDQQMQTAITNKDQQGVTTALITTIKAEVMRRLNGAEQNINDYQVAKVLVVKSKLFIDLLAADLTADNRQQADIAIRGALASIGNPGVFGVGQKPADVTRYIKYRTNLQAALQFTLPDAPTK